MLAIVYGPVPCPKGKTPAEYEASEALRREKVVATEEGCLMYQLVSNDKNKTYYIFELYKNQQSLDIHFNNMGMKNGAPPLNKIKYETSPLKIYHVVGGYLHPGGDMTIGNVISLPLASGMGSIFERAVVPSLATYDLNEPNTGCYLLCKRPDESEYVFIELFQNQSAIDVHSKSSAFKEMSKKIGKAKTSAKNKKATFVTNMRVCVETTRKKVIQGGGGGGSSVSSKL